jgi:hypothetical protein
MWKWWPQELCLQEFASIHISRYACWGSLLCSANVLLCYVVCLKEMSVCSRPQPLVPSYQPHYAICLYACLHSGKMKWNELLQACYSLNEDTINFLISTVSWMLPDIMTESFYCFQKCNRNSGCRFFVELFAQNFEQIIICWSPPTIMSWELHEGCR